MNRLFCVLAALAAVVALCSDVSACHGSKGHRERGKLFQRLKKEKPATACKACVPEKAPMPKKAGAK